MKRQQREFLMTQVSLWMNDSVIMQCRLCFTKYVEVRLIEVKKKRPFYDNTFHTSS